MVCGRWGLRVVSDGRIVNHAWTMRFHLTVATHIDPVFEFVSPSDPVEIYLNTVPSPTRIENEIDPPVPQSSEDTIY